MKSLLILSFFFAVSVSCYAQNFDTTYQFMQSPIKHVSTIHSLKDTVVGKYTLSFRLDSTDSDIQYAELKNKQGEILYNGIFKNEVLKVEIKDQKGLLLNKTSYKLKEVYPIRGHVIVLGDPEVKDRYKLVGFLKEFIRDGYTIKYKNGREVSRTYYSEGKVLKLKL